MILMTRFAIICMTPMQILTVLSFRICFYLEFRAMYFAVEPTFQEEMLLPRGALMKW